MGRTPAVISAVTLAIMFTAIGFVWGRGTAPKVAPMADSCAECCPEGEMCVDKDEWAATEIGVVNEQAAAEEYSKMLKACENKVQDITIKGLPELINVRIASAECEGMLKECRRK